MQRAVEPCEFPLPTPSRPLAGPSVDLDPLFAPRSIRIYQLVSLQQPRLSEDHYKYASRRLSFGVTSPNDASVALMRAIPNSHSKINRESEYYIKTERVNWKADPRVGKTQGKQRRLAAEGGQVFRLAVEKLAVAEAATGGKRRKAAERRDAVDGSERFSRCEDRCRGDGKIIESRLSHRSTKEIFHRPTNFLAKWPCIKIAG